MLHRLIPLFDISTVNLRQAIAALHPTVTPLQQDFITMPLLKGIMPAIPAAILQPMPALLNQLLPKYKLNTKEVFPDFIAQCAEECESFSRFTEGLNYSAARLHEVFPSRFPTLASAQPYEHNPQKLANHVYANRMGNGNEQSGDGWKYRGSGAIQLTGKTMITSYAKYKGQDPVVMAGLLKNDLSEILESAMWFFVVVKSLLDEAQKDDIISITKAINGGETNLAARKVFFERACKLMAA